MYEDLENLANLKIAKAIEVLAQQNSERISDLIQNHAKRGISQSGIAERAKLRSQLQMASELCEAIHRIWVDLILTKDKALTEESVAFIGGKVQEAAINKASAIRHTLGSNLSHAGRQELEREADTHITGIVARVHRDLEIMRREQALISHVIGRAHV